MFFALHVSSLCVLGFIITLLHTAFLNIKFVSDLKSKMRVKRRKRKNNNEEIMDQKIDFKDLHKPGICEREREREREREGVL